MEKHILYLTVEKKMMNITLHTSTATTNKQMQ